MKEIEFLHRILPVFHTPQEAVVPNGDDCGAVRCSDAVLLLAADQLIAGVHFDPSDTTPEEAGAKLLKRNLSDIAAMGGEPRWALCTLAVGGFSEDWLARFFQGVEDCGKRYCTAILGGDLAHVEHGLIASLSIAGTLTAPPVCRSGVKPGDRLYVTGELGNSYFSRHHLHFTPRLAEGKFLAEKSYASAMMDLSDGLLLDASRMAESSRCQLRIDPAKLPLRQGATVSGAMGDGEDYELLFAVPQEKEPELLQNFPASFAPLTCIGEAVCGSGVTDRLGNVISCNKGYEHEL